MTAACRFPHIFAGICFQLAARKLFAICPGAFHSLGHDSTTGACSLREAAARNSTGESFAGFEIPRSRGYRSPDTRGLRAPGETDADSGGPRFDARHNLQCDWPVATE